MNAVARQLVQQDARERKLEGLGAWACVDVEERHLFWGVDVCAHWDFERDHVGYAPKTLFPLVVSVLARVYAHEDELAPQVNLIQRALNLRKVVVAYVFADRLFKIFLTFARPTHVAVGVSVRETKLRIGHECAGVSRRETRLALLHERAGAVVQLVGCRKAGGVQARRLKAVVVHKNFLLVTPVYICSCSDEDEDEDEDEGHSPMGGGMPTVAGHRKPVEDKYITG